MAARLHPASSALAPSIAALSVVIVVGEIVFRTPCHGRPARSARAIADRELALETLIPGERVLARVSVFRRPGIDLFRATRGVLARADESAVDAIYLGVRPRDLSLRRRTHRRRSTSATSRSTRSSTVQSGRAFLGW